MMIDGEVVDTIEKTYLDKIHNWKNDDNAQYYEKLPEGTLQEYAKLGGLDACCDLELIHPQIMQASSILEVAAGYGRVLNGLIQMGYKNKVVAIERCAKFYSLLRAAYEKKKFQNMEIIKADIREFAFKEKFDLILWMWSGMCDFREEEQFSILSKLTLQLNSNGMIVLDTMPCSVAPRNAVWFSEHYSIIDGKGGPYLYVYVPPNEQIDVYAVALGLKVKHLPYLTSTNRPRVLHILY